MFVHGLGGDPFDTWVGPGTPRDDCWLNWVGQDTGCDTWTLGYDSALSRWQDQAMPLPDQGTQVAQLLAVHPGLKDRNMVLVGHSMGGLVIKTVITQSQAAGDVRARALVGRIRGVVFLATPHQGSQLASLAKAVAGALRTNAQVGDMSRHDAHLRQLGTAFREQRQALHLKVAAFAEGRDVVRRQRGWFGLLTRQVGVRVVDPSSSDLALEGVTTVPLAEDHFSICKPSSRDAQVHHALVAFIREEILVQQRGDLAQLLPPLPAASPTSQSAYQPTGSLDIGMQRTDRDDAGVESIATVAAPVNPAEVGPVAMARSLFHLGDDGPQSLIPYAPTRNQLMLFLLGWAVYPERVQLAQIETALTAPTQTLADALDEVIGNRWSVKNSDGTYSLTLAGVEDATKTVRRYKMAA